MKFHKAAIFIYSLLSFHVIVAQQLGSVTYKLDGRFVKMREYRPVANFDRVFLVFDTSDINASGLDLQLIDLAHHFKSKIVVCADKPSVPEYESFVEQLGLDSHQRIFVFAKGECADLASSVFAADGYGLLLHPKFDSITLAEMSTAGGVAVLPNTSDSTLALLKHAGFWLLRNELTTPESIFETVNFPNIHKAITWSDSLWKLQADSSFVWRLNQAAGLQTEIPEVLLQGQQLNLDLFIGSPGGYRIEVLNLSSEIVADEGLFLGRGLHKIQISTKEFEWGVYHLEIEGSGIDIRRKIIVRG